MAAFLILLVLILSISPVSADLETLEGCQAWGGDIAEEWEAIVAHPDSIGDNAGFFTEDANEGFERLEVFFSFGGNYQVNRVELEWWIETPIVPQDYISLYLPSDVLLFQWSDPDEHIVEGVPQTLIWEGEITADSIRVYMRAPTEDFSRGILSGATICVQDAPRMQHALQLLISTGETLGIAVALTVGFSIAVLLIRAALAMLS